MPTAANAVTLTLQGDESPPPPGSPPSFMSPPAVGVVRVWQRRGCCFNRLQDIEIVLNVSGSLTVLPFASQPDLFAQVNFGAEIFSWRSGSWSSASCPSACGIAASVITRSVSCVGDRGSQGVEGQPGCTTAGKPTNSGTCPHTGCCGQAPFFVSSNGDDAASGCSPSQPMRTLSACVAAAEGSGGGTSCFLLPGSYHESVSANGVTNLTIARAPDWAIPAGSRAQAVLLEGAPRILGGWDQLTDDAGQSYYRSRLAVTSPRVWQLFVDNETLTSARYPNARMWTPAAWSRTLGWAGQAAGTTCGHSVDAGTIDPSGSQTLAALNVSVAGCNLIINNEHWVTRRYEVLSHTAGTGVLEYNNTASSSTSLCQRYATDLAVNKYFIDGCLAVFDAPGEWTYDGDHLVVRLPAGVPPLAADDERVSGKDQTCALPPRPNPAHPPDTSPHLDPRVLGARCSVAS